MYPSPAGEAFLVNGVWHQDYNIQDPVTGVVSVKRYMHNGVDWVEAPSAGAKIDLMKRIPDTKSGINLKKNVINLDKCLVDLTKYGGPDMTHHEARVAVIMDYSGSMRPLYKNGNIQRTLNRLIPLALRFDDNGELDVWLFHSGFKRLDSMALDNYEDYVEEVMMGSGERFGSTSYGPVLTDAYNKYVNEVPSKVPTFIIFITDGSNNDRKVTNDIIKKTSHQNIFVQFVGIGDMDDFIYLKRLDDLKGRPVDNTGFIEIEDFDNVSDDKLYTELLSQYIDWLKVKGIM